MHWRTWPAVILGDDELERMPGKALSFALLVAALVCAWVPHRQTYWGYWESWVSFTPDFISGVLALAIIGPLYARRIIPYPYHSISGILAFCVNLALVATVCQIALGKGTGLSTLPAVAVITAAIALSWLGMRAAASLAWLGLLAFSVVSAVYSNYAWGLAGFGFVACGFCGILLQTQLNPQAMFLEIFTDYIKYDSFNSNVGMSLNTYRQERENEAS